MSSDGDNNMQSTAGGNVMSEQLYESHGCRAIDESTGEVCGQTDGLRILDQFRRIYEDRMERIEQAEAAGTEADFGRMRLNLMKEWIKDLSEQNFMLVRTVEDLEQAACERVKLLEEKLRETAGIVSEKMSKLAKPSEEAVNCLSTRICELEREEVILQEKIEYLKSDIRGLLELIRRARCENCWCLKGIKFFEVQPEDIPSPTECSCAEEADDNETVESLKQRLRVLNENEKKALEYQGMLEGKVCDLDKKLVSREETIRKYISMLESLRDNLKKRCSNAQSSFISSRSNDNEFDIASFVEVVESAFAAKSRSEEKRDETQPRDSEIEDLRAQLHEKSIIIEKLSRSLTSLEKENQETREALTKEVSEEHDMRMALKSEIETLKEECNRVNMRMELKDDIIKEMRKEIIQRSEKKSAPGSSGRKVRISSGVAFREKPEECSSQSQTDFHETNLVSDLNNAKASWKRENAALHYLRSELEEVLEELHAKEREDYERDMANAHTKLRDIGTLLDNYKTEVIDRGDSQGELKLNSNKVMIQKLAKSIANLTKVCAENVNGIDLLERALEKSEKVDASHNEPKVTPEPNERWRWEAFNSQFNAMEEFRVCTVEAQAATENLREEVEIVVENLQMRHQRFLDVSEVIKQLQNLLSITIENLSSVMCHLDKQREEKLRHSERVASGEMQLKDLKNELNRSRLTSRDVVDFTHKNSSDLNSPRDAIGQVLDVVEQVVCHLGSVRSKDECELSLLNDLRSQLCNIESKLNDVQNGMESVLSENEIAEKVFNDKNRRLDKFEKELDYAHTKMQDTLESIVQSKQKMIDDGVCNLCSCTPSEAAMPGSHKMARNEDNYKNSSEDIQQLKNTLRSKEKLLIDKDEIIRIQKDSITMTHVELKDLHQKMQAKAQEFIFNLCQSFPTRKEFSAKVVLEFPLRPKTCQDVHINNFYKIDAQNIAITQHVEEKKLLLEQSKLQSQTIGHLRDAVVEAKRCLATQQQSQQKSGIDLSVSELGDKDETIRLLSIYLRETQAQYHDCFLQAAEQDKQLELQREAIESLHRTIICRDIVYYSILIRAQEFFHGRIGDARSIRTKLENLVKSKKCLEEKCRRVKRLWREADRELRKIKCVSSLETESYKCSRCKDSSTSTEENNIMDEKIETKMNFLLRENEDLKKQLKNRRIEMDLFDEEVKNQLENKISLETVGECSRSEDSENCSRNDNIELESVLKEHLAHAKSLIDELQVARDKESVRVDSEQNINCGCMKNNLHRKNLELEKLMNEAKDKQDFSILQDMRNQLEKSENLERMNERLKKELSNIKETAEIEYCVREQDFPHQTNEAEKVVICGEMEKSAGKEIVMIKKLKDQLSSTRELTEECLAEMRMSKEILSFLRERIFSLKRLLKEKSDELANLQADHEIIKNDYSILKTENGRFEEKARAEIREFRDKLKCLQTELHLMDDNYRKVSEDYDKSQKCLMEAARREVELQQGISSMEQIFCSKLSGIERENKRLSDLVDILRSDLQICREELSTREEDYSENCRDAYEEIENLEDQVSFLEDSKRLLIRQLQESKLDNCKLRNENSRLKENGCRCIKELEETHNALLELKGKCKTKTQTLNSISAELNHVAASRSELCDESQRVVSCIRAWIEEQRKLVENLSKKLKNEKNRIARYAFEKKALVETVKELSRVNGTLSDLSMRRKFPQPQSPRRCSESNENQTTCTKGRKSSASSTTVYTRPLKRRCVCLTKTSRRTLLRGNSWWFPKLEHVSKELSRKNRRHMEKENEDSMSETSLDETRDFGYQSSASK